MWIIRDTGYEDFYHEETLTNLDPEHAWKLFYDGNPDSDPDDHECVEVILKPVQIVTDPRP